MQEGTAEFSVLFTENIYIVVILKSCSLTQFFLLYYQIVKNFIAIDYF